MPISSIDKRMLEFLASENEKSKEKGNEDEEEIEGENQEILSNFISLTNCESEGYDIMIDTSWISFENVVGCLSWRFL